MTGAVTTPLDHAETARDASGIPNEHVDLAITLIESAPGAKYSGKKPAGVFAAAVYAASIIKGERLTQNTLGITFDVTMGPIRNGYKLFIKTSTEHNIPDHAIDDLTSEEIAELITGCRSLDEYDRDDLFTFVAQKHGWVDSNIDGTISSSNSSYSGDAVTLGDEPSVNAEPIKRFTRSLNLLNSLKALVNEYGFDPETDLQVEVSLTTDAYQDLVLKSAPDVLTDTPLGEFKQFKTEELVEILSDERGWELPGPNDDPTPHFRPGSPPEITISGITNIVEANNSIDALLALGNKNVEITDFTITRTGYVKLAEDHIAEQAYVLDQVEPGTIYANSDNTIVIVDAEINKIAATGSITYAELTDDGRGEEKTLPAFSFAETILDQYTQIKDEVIDRPHETVNNFVGSVLTTLEQNNGSEPIGLDEPDRLEESLGHLSPIDLRVAYQLTEYSK